MASNETSPAAVDRLYWAASHHARAASMKAVSRDPHVRMDAAIHAGASVELMAKAILARTDDRLLVEDRDAHHVVVDVLAGSGRFTASTRRGKPSRTTVSARKALDLAIRVCREIRPHEAGATAALTARNAAAHAAEVDDTELTAQVAAANEFVLAGVDSFGRSRSDFLGDTLQQIEREVAEQNAALRMRAQHAVDLARQRYETPAAVAVGSDPEKPDSHIPFYGDLSDPYECPACANQGWLIWNVEVEQDPSGGRDMNAYLDYRGFECFYCGLQLNDVESEAVGIKPHGDPADYFDVLPED